MVTISTRRSRSQQRTLKDKSAQNNDMPRPKSAHSLYPKTGDAVAAKKRAKSEKRAASRARGGSTERVVAPESKGVIEVKVRHSADGSIDYWVCARLSCGTCWRDSGLCQQLHKRRGNFSLAEGEHELRPLGECEALSHQSPHPLFARSPGSPRQWPLGIHRLEQSM